METKKKRGRYERIEKQLIDLCRKPWTPLSRMATIAAVLHHKMDHYFWTGFYLLEENRLVAGPYQGPVACQELELGQGVCWATVNQKAAIVVPDVHRFPGHIACDARSRSEITVPVLDHTGSIKAVMDVDSSELDQFDQVDREFLERIVPLIYGR